MYAFFAVHLLTFVSVLFYVLTLVDEESGEEQVIGYFSKVGYFAKLSLSILTLAQERFSFNSHNLACIIVLPPWQKRGFGMLMIEFSSCSRRPYAQSLTYIQVTTCLANRE